MSEVVKALGVLALAGIGLVLLARRAPLATRDKTTPGYWREWGRIRRLLGVLVLVAVVVVVAGRFGS
jgi:hypothetical protein